MKRIINFSGETCSLFAAQRSIRDYGAGNVSLLFADTLIEHSVVGYFHFSSCSLGFWHENTCK